MGPTWGPPGSCWPQMGPMLAPRTLLSGVFILRQGPAGHSRSRVGCLIYSLTLSHVIRQSLALLLGTTHHYGHIQLYNIYHIVIYGLILPHVISSVTGISRIGTTLHWGISRYIIYIILWYIDLHYHISSVQPQSFPGRGLLSIRDMYSHIMYNHIRIYGLRLSQVISPVTGISRVVAILH